MAVPSLGNVLTKLAKSQKQIKAAKQRALTAKETAAERWEYMYHSGLRFGAAGIAGAADARIDDTMAGIPPSGLAGVALGVASLSGILGSATKSARSVAEGALCGTFYRQGYLMGGGAPLLPGGAAKGAMSGSHMGQGLDADDENEILIALQEESERNLADAEEYID